MNWYEPFAAHYPLRWQMRPAERLALIALLHVLRPSTAIEVGTADGGSLQVIASASQRVYTLDIDPTAPTRLPHFANVQFRIGPSADTLRELLAELRATETPVPFILIDGNHATEFVKQDIQALLSVRPLCRTYVMFHDSFNPDCRLGIEKGGWEACPFVHKVDLDFVQGWFHDDETGIPGEMWGGFALALLDPEDRQGPLRIKASQDPTFRQMYSVSAHRLRA